MGVILEPVLFLIFMAVALWLALVVLSRGVMTKDFSRKWRLQMYCSIMFLVLVWYGLGRYIPDQNYVYFRHNAPVSWSGLEVAHIYDERVDRRVSCEVRFDRGIMYEIRYKVKDPNPNKSQTTQAFRAALAEEFCRSRVQVLGDGGVVYDLTNHIIYDLVYRRLVLDERPHYAGARSFIYKVYFLYCYN